MRQTCKAGSHPCLEQWAHVLLYMVCMYIYIYMRIYIYIRVGICVCVIYICVCMCICMYRYICMCIIWPYRAVYKATLGPQYLRYGYLDPCGLTLDPPGLTSVGSAMPVVLVTRFWA